MTDFFHNDWHAAGYALQSIYTQQAKGGEWVYIYHSDAECNDSISLLSNCAKKHYTTIDQILTEHQWTREQMEQIAQAQWHKANTPDKRKEPLTK